MHWNILVASPVRSPYHLPVAWVPCLVGAFGGNLAWPLRTPDWCPRRPASLLDQSYRWIICSFWGTFAPLTCDGPFCWINSCLVSGTGWMLFPTSSCLHPQHSPWCLFGFQMCVQMYREYISEPSWYASSLGREQLKITVGQKNSGSFILKRPVTHIHLVSECTQCVKTWLCIMCVTLKVIRWFDCFKAS